MRSRLLAAQDRLSERVVAFIRHIQNGGHESEIKQPEAAKCPVITKSQARIMTQVLPIH